jgi:hypothetical protein
MDEYVQYHNPDYASWPSEEDSAGFGIYSSKPVGNVRGSRIWLAARKEDTREYYLVYWFIADSVVVGAEGETNHIDGRTGTWLRPPVRIDQLPWFNKFRKYMGNFGLGLQRIADPDLVAALQSTIGDTERAGDDVLFGDAASNSEVEQAAITAVRNDYEARGWTVRSVERDRIGFDLECTRLGESEHVEVKGTSGVEIGFIITVGERDRSHADPRFVLYVVTEARTRSILHRFSGQDVSSRFDFRPLQFRARLKPGAA